MVKVNLHFKLSISQFIHKVRELSFETVDIDLKKYYNPNDPYVYEGDLKGLWVLKNLEIVVICRGITGFVWTLDVKIGNEKLTKKPIEGKINAKGISVHDKSYPLP